METVNDIASPLGYSASLLGSTRKFLRYAVFGVTVVGKEYACLPATCPGSSKHKVSLGRILVSSEFVSMTGRGGTVTCEGEDGVQHSSQDESVIQYLEFNCPVSYAVAYKYVSRLYDMSVVWEHGAFSSDRLVPWPVVGRLQSVMGSRNMWPHAIYDESIGDSSYWPSLFGCSIITAAQAMGDRSVTIQRSEQAVINSERFALAANFLRTSYSVFPVDIWNDDRQYFVRFVDERDYGLACSAHWNAYKCIEELYTGQLPRTDASHVREKFENMYRVDLEEQWRILIATEKVKLSLLSAIYSVLKKRNDISGHGGASRDPKAKRIRMGEVLDAQLLARNLLIACSSRS